MKRQVQSSARQRRDDASGSGRVVVPRRRQSRSDSRKREILRAALHCFTTIGFAGTTLADIRVRAKASIGSIYHHFRSKEQLAAALYVEGLRDYQESFLAELDRHRRAREAVISLVRHHLRWVRDNPDWSRFLYDHRQSEFVAAAEGAIRHLNEGFYRASGARWQGFLDRGEIVELPRDLMIAILLGPAQEFARNWLGGRTRTELGDAADVLAECAWRALSNPKPRPHARPARRAGSRGR
jgi:AcrR family transcriptional regulator